MVGISATLAYRIESGSRPLGDVMARIVKLGACKAEDWFAEDDGREGRAA